MRTDLTPEMRFNAPFQIGRREDADVPMRHEFVSRSHVEVSFREGRWWAIDMGSANGMFIEGERQAWAPIDETLTIRLGVEGPFVQFIVEPPPPVVSPDQVQHAIGRYFGDSKEPAGEHTMVLRQAFQQVKKREKRKYGWIIALLGFCALGAGGYAFYLHQQSARRAEMALQIFYSMKTLDVDVSRLERMLQEANVQRGGEQLDSFRKRREGMERDYNKFLESLHTYDKKFTPKQKLAVRIARVFGESELAMPPEFLTEIEAYIAKWQGSNRLSKALAAARAGGYLTVITQELLAQGLPPQFMYLALQESNFEPYASGPPTRSGIAKGMWQFVPETAVKYGMKVGPLVELPRPDPGDDRHNWERATKAAAAYLKDLYSTDAQASGLLVMSCYNWGEDQVIPMIKKMPANPRERNFWKLLAMGKEKIPHETYDYVFSIASAAVIGEDPRLFGFDFDNPLGFLEERQRR